MRHRPSGVVVVLSTRPDGESTESALDHLAFAVPDGDVLEEWAGHLKRAGIDHPGVVLELGKPSLQLRDLDGNAIERSSRPSRALDAYAGAATGARSSVRTRFCPVSASK